MTRRLTLILALVVLGAVTISTVLTIAVGAVRARAASSDEVADVAAGLVRRSTQLSANPERLPAACAVAGRALRLELITCVELDRNGTLRPLGGIGTNRALEAAADVLPDSVDGALARLAAGEVLTGVQGRRVWALAALRPDEVGRGPTPAVAVVRRTQNPVSVLGVRWLVISSVVTAAAGVLAAWLLARRLAEPLRRATAATHDLAAGQLDVRLPVDEGAPADDELAELSRSINALGVSLQRSRGLEQRFLLSVSHDLRTPLTSIRGYADALADGTLTDVGKGASIIQQEALRLERLVGDLLDLARLDAHSFRFELRRVDLSVVARESVDALSPDAARNGVTLQVQDGATGPLDVVADPDRLAQVVANLLENALKFAIGRVVVETAEDPGDGGYAVLRVTDDGPGVAPEDLPHVFERLYVSKRVPVRKEAGSGLGLAIVRELVDAMGGQVLVTAAEPRGTCFTVRLARSAVVR